MLNGTPPLLIIVTGLPGTGKTTFARALSDRVGGRHLNTDIIRDELGMRGQYDEKSKQKVYRKMEERTAEALEKGEQVIVDGTFYRKKLRKPYQELGAKAGAQVFWFVIEAPEETVKERVSQRREYSEADFDVYRKVRNAWEPLDKPHRTIQSGPLEGMLEEALSYLIIRNDGA